MTASSSLSLARSQLIENLSLDDDTSALECALARNAFTKRELTKDFTKNLPLASLAARPAGGTRWCEMPFKLPVFTVSAVEYRKLRAAEGGAASDDGARVFRTPSQTELPALLSFLRFAALAHHRRALEAKAAAAASLAGKTVLLSGLVGRTALNGRTGVASTFNAASGRYTVVVDGETLALNASNLQVAEGGDGAAAPSSRRPIGAMMLECTSAKETSADDDAAAAGSSGAGGGAEGGAEGVGDSDGPDDDDDAEDQGAHDELKEPPSAFELYCKAKRAKVQADHPGFGPTRVSDWLTLRWSKIPAERKAKYEAKAAKLKAKHDMKKARAGSAAAPRPIATARDVEPGPGPAPARIATAQDIDPGPILVNCPRVLIGKFDAGATQVSFDGKHISFMLGHPTPVSEQYVLVNLTVTAMTKFEVDKSRGTLCFWGMWDLVTSLRLVVPGMAHLPFAHEFDNLYQPFKSDHEPESSIFIEFDKAAYVTRSGDIASRSWPSKILAVNPQYERLVRFTDGHPGRVVLQPRLSGTAASSSAASAPAPAPAPAPAASWAEALNGASGVAAGSVGLAGSSSRDSLGSAPSVRGFGRLLADSAPAAAPSGAAAKRPAPAPAPAPAAKKKAKAQPTANDVVIDLDSD